MSGSLQAQQVTVQAYNDAVADLALQNNNVTSDNVAITYKQSQIVTANWRTGECINWDI